MAYAPKPLDVLLFVALMTPMCCCTGFGLWFAPGWANGWPLDRRIVWPSGLAVFAFAATLLLAAIVWAAFRGPEEPPPTWPPGRDWVLGSVGVSVAVAVGVFVAFRAQAFALWP
jgi:hypothetical protein